MVENADDLSVHWEEGGQVTTEELDKRILSKGSWTTIIFKYRDFDSRKGEMGPPKFTIRRYQKRNGAYRQQAKFNISSVKQAKGIIEALEAWVAEEEQGA